MEVYIAQKVDTTLELTCFIISPNKLLLTVSERLVNLYQVPQHAPTYIKPYTGHDNQNSPHMGQSTPVPSVLLLFNLEGFYASSASLQGELHIPAQPCARAEMLVSRIRASALLLPLYKWVC